MLDFIYNLPQFNLFLILYKVKKSLISVVILKPNLYFLFLEKLTKKDPSPIIIPIIKFKLISLLGIIIALILFIVNSVFLILFNVIFLLIVSCASLPPKGLAEIIIYLNDLINNLN